MGVSVAVALLALAISYFAFGNGKNVPAEDSEMAGLQKVVYEKYYVDEIYQKLFVNPIKSLSQLLGTFFDTKVIDGAINGIGKGVIGASDILRKMQVGGTGTYLFFITIGIILVMGLGFVPYLFEALKAVVK